MSACLITEINDTPYISKDGAKDSLPNLIAACGIFYERPMILSDRLSWLEINTK
jgi:hypothetical protein